MQAVVFHGVGDIRLEDVPEPKIEVSTDAIVRITASAICGTDLHMVRGTMPGMEEGTILGHEGIGIVEALGEDVRNLSVGDRVVIPSTIACGTCVYCRAGYHAQCDNANPHGKRAGTAFYGGPASTGAFPGLQAELARVPFAHVNLVRLPPEVTDDQAITISDVFPTGYFGAELLHVHAGHTVAVFGAGPVGLFAIASLRLMEAGRIFAIDRVPSRLEMARELGAEIINFDEEDPVEALLRLTGGIGVDRALDAVGVDADAPESGAGLEKAETRRGRDERERSEIAGDGRSGSRFQPGRAPSQALDWAVEAVAKAGTIAIVGVYPPSARSFPIGEAMLKNLTIRMGNCNHRKYTHRLIEIVRTGLIDPGRIVTQREPLTDAISAFEHFDERETSWVKVMLSTRASTSPPRRPRDRRITPLGRPDTSHR